VSAVKPSGVKLFFAVALALTLGLKLFLAQWEALHQQAPAPAEPESLGEAVAAFLHQHGFQSRLEQRFGQFFVHANAGKCRVLISETDPEG
jgi:hypothetical protein